ARTAARALPLGHRAQYPCRRRRPRGRPSRRDRLPAHLWDRGCHRLRHGCARGHRLRYVLVVRARCGGEPPAVRLRGGRDRRPGLAVGHPGRGHGARSGPSRGSPDQPQRRRDRRSSGVPRRPRRPAPGAHPRPDLGYSGTTDTFVNFFILLIMASMWNLLAGYAGLVSVGQQAFIGLGAYFVLIAAQHGMSPFSAIPVAAVGCAVVALPVSWLVFRLRGGYFAIATWVVAEVFELVISRFSSLGGGTGKSLPGLSLSRNLLT